MAENSESSPKGSLPLEEQSRDELIAHSKKLHLLLQKTRTNFEKHRLSCQESEKVLNQRLEEALQEMRNLKDERNLSGPEACTGPEDEACIGSLEESVSHPNLNDLTNELNLLREEKQGLIERNDVLEDSHQTALEFEKRMVQALDENKQLQERLDVTLETVKNYEAKEVALISESRSENQNASAGIEEKLLETETQLKQLEEEKRAWQASMTQMSCRLEELESNVRVLSADHDNDQDHICKLSERIAEAEKAESAANNRLLMLQSSIDDMSKTLSTSCGIILAANGQQLERYAQLCIDVVGWVSELRPGDARLFKSYEEGLREVCDSVIYVENSRKSFEFQVQTLNESHEHLREDLENANAKIASLQSALEEERTAHEEAEQKYMTAISDNEIQSSTIVALTEQLEQAHDLPRLSAEANTTDDDKNSSDDARSEQQMAELRDRLAALQSELQSEKQKHVEDIERNQRLTASLESKEILIKSMQNELDARGRQINELGQRMEEKTSLVENLHSTLDDMVERMNGDVFNHPNDGCSVVCRLLRELEEISNDFSRSVSDADLPGKRSSDQPLEVYLRRVLRQLVSQISKLETREVCAPRENCEQPDGKEQAIQERDEKILKLKSLLVKMKKELTDLKTKAQPDTSVMASNIQSLQTEYDKAVDALEEERNLRKELEKKVNQTMEMIANMELDLSKVQDERSQLHRQVERCHRDVEDAQRLKAESDAQVLILRNDLELGRLETDRLRQELCGQIQSVTTLQVEVSSLQQKLDKGHDALVEIGQTTERARRLEEQLKDVQCSLDQTVTRKAEIELCLQEMTDRCKDYEALRCNLAELELKHGELGGELDESRREVDRLRACLQEALESTRDISEQKSAFETRETDLNDEIKRLTCLVEEHRESSGRLARTLDQKCAALKREKDVISIELEEVRNDFEAYKLKVLTMMKSKKPDKPEATGRASHDENVVSMMKGQIEDLEKALANTQSDLQSATEQLKRSHSKIEELEQQLSGQEAVHRDALRKQAIKNERLLREQIEAERRDIVERETARHSERIASIERNHRSLTEVLEEKLSEVRLELERLRETRKETSRVIPDLQNNNNDVFLDSVHLSDGSQDMARTLPFDVIPTSGFQPLEQLLGDQAIISYETFESLKSKLEDALQRNDHMTDLLNESEVNNLRLSEQTRLLKDELRRYERNQERDEQFGNLEYLKNVVLKYLTLKSEKEKLIPVLCTMLKLSPAEKRLLEEGGEEQSWNLLPKFL